MLFAQSACSAGLYVLNVAYPLGSLIAQKVKGVSWNFFLRLRGHRRVTLDERPRSATGRTVHLPLCGDDGGILLGTYLGNSWRGGSEYHILPVVSTARQHYSRQQ